MIFDLVPDDRKVRAFSLSPSFIDQFKGKQPNWGYDGLGYFTYKRTYSRPTCDCVDPTKCGHPTEEFWQTCKRVVEGVYTIQKIHCRRFHLPWSGVKSQRSAQDMFQRMWDFKFLPPGRGLWMMGTDVVYERGAAALNNCGFSSTENIQIDFAGPFSFLMDMSMLGVGVGGDTRGAGKVRLSLPRLDDELFVVEDSREGWVNIISTVLNSFVGKGQYPAVIDFQRVRKRGEPLKTFGGISSGPRPLIELIENLVRLLLPPNVEVLFSPWDPDDPTGPQLITTFKEVGDVEPYRITSSQIVDVFNYIGKAVVAGGIRRCLPKGTLVHTSTGLLPVEDVEPGMSVVSSDGYTKVTDWVAQGVQPITSITTQMGSFECTDKHKIAVVSDTKGGYSWKKAFELEPGDRMVFVDHVVEGSLTNLPPYKYDPPAHSTTCKDINIPKLDPKMAWFFGMFHGDGYVTSPLNKGHVSVVVALGQESLLFRVQEQLERFGIHVGVLNPVEGNQCYKAQVSSKQLAAYLGQFKQAKEVLVIPGFVMQGLPEIRAAYVAGLFDADGSCRNRPLVVSSSVYPSYLKQVQSVLASLGVPSRFSLHKDKNRVPNGWQPLYKLTVVGEKALQRWEERVAPFALKYEDLRKSSRSGNDYGFPSKMALEDGVTGYHDGSMVWNRASRQITVARLEQVTGQDVNLVPVEVLGVEHGVREDETFDISTEAHEFVAQGGYLVHNTAEIMFGDHDDHDFVTLKQDKGALKDRRWASNNSIWGTVGMDYGEVAESIAKNGEPGIIWLENAQAFSRMNGIADWKDRRAKGANPCFVGDTLIAVADGRGAVPILQLVEEKNDVPVYSMDPKTGKVEIKMGRNPRLTRESSPLVEVELDDGSTFRVTPDHKMILLDGTHCDAKDLHPGDSLPGFQKGASDLEGEARWSKAFSEASKRGHRAGDRVSDPVFFAKLLEAHTVADDLDGEASPKHMSSQRRDEILAYYKEQEAKTDLETVWMGERLYAVRSCETCGEDFVVAWRMRGQSYCSHACLNKAESHIQKHQVGQDVTQDYNLRVKDVRHLDVGEPVYNLSVTDHHTVCVVTNGTPKGQRSGIFTSNCVEQTLEDRELCCLVETFPAHHDDLEDYKKTLKTAYLYAKSVTLIPTHNPKTNAVLMRNRRIGCSMSGIQQAKTKLGHRHFLSWADSGYQYIQDLDTLYSEWLCIPRSIKTTSVKPSGTVSLLAGATPGIHYPHSEYYIRNIRVKNTSSLVDAAREAGYFVEEDAYADDTSVISFPVSEKHFTKGKRDVSIWEQFADAAALQRHWADNQVSCTVSFSKEEADSGYIARCLEIYEDQLKAISLLPLDDHGYEQAPYIEIDEATYKTMHARIKPLNLDGSRHEVTDKFCDGEACEIDFNPKN